MPVWSTLPLPARKWLGPHISSRQNAIQYSQRLGQVESGCEIFLTNDNQLANFPDLIIEVLP